MTALPLVLVVARPRRRGTHFMWHLFNWQSGGIAQGEAVTLEAIELELRYAFGVELVGDTWVPVPNRAWQILLHVVSATGLPQSRAGSDRGAAGVLPGVGTGDAEGRPAGLDTGSVPPYETGAVRTSPTYGQHPSRAGGTARRSGPKTTERRADTDPPAALVLPAPGLLRCSWCTEPMGSVRTSGGRPRQYCSDRCRKAAARFRAQLSDLAQEYGEIDTASENEGTEP